MTETASKPALLNANGTYLSEQLGFHALALSKTYSAFELEDATAHMNYVQRILADCNGTLKMALITLDDLPEAAIRFNFCGCLVIEDNTMRDDMVEFKVNGRVLAQITGLCTSMPAGWAK